MDGNGEGKDATREISSADEPALSPADRCTNSDCVEIEPVQVDHECCSLLNIRDNKIEDEDQDLVDANVSLFPPSDEQPGQSEEQEYCGDERDRTHGCHDW